MYNFKALRLKYSVCISGILAICMHITHLSYLRNIHVHACSNQPAHGSSVHITKLVYVYVYVYVLHFPVLQTFWDLTSLYEEGSNGSLHIIENEFLGKGGFGFVCKGELRQEVNMYINCMLQLDSQSTVQVLCREEPSMLNNIILFLCSTNLSFAHTPLFVHVHYTCPQAAGDMVVALPTSTP